MKHIDLSNTFFITLSDKPNNFIHHTGKNGDGYSTYQIKQGLIGAAVFYSESADAFIKNFGTKNLVKAPAAKFLLQK